jgi:hypothetical protein
MPPLLAALLMIELGCDLRIVEAIDRGQEWRRWQISWGSAVDRYANCADTWYAGWLGKRPNQPLHTVGSFLWPSKHWGQRYARRGNSH